MMYGEASKDPSKISWLKNQTLFRYEFYNNVVRFYYDLEPEEKFYLLVGTGALGVNAVTNLYYPRILGRLIDYPTGGLTIKNFTSTSFENQNKGIFSTLLSVVTKPLVVYAVGSIASFVRVYCFKYAENLTQNRYKRKLYSKFMVQNASFFRTQPSSFFVSKLMRNCEKGPESMIRSYTYFLRSYNSMFFGFVNLLSISPKLGMLSIATFSVSTLILNILKTPSNKIKERHSLTQDLSFEYAIEAIENIESVITNSMGDWELNKFAFLLKECTILFKSICKIDGLSMAAILGCINAATFLLFSYGRLAIEKGSLSHGNMASFFMYGGFMGLGVMAFYKFYKNLIDAITYMKALYEVLDSTKPYKHGIIPETISGDILVNNVDFSYVDGGKVFENLSLTIKPKHITVIVGPSGTGKTTLCKLLIGLYQPTSGVISLDDIDMATLDSNWLFKNVFAFVSQTPFIMSISVKDNIKYGNEAISMDEITEKTRAFNIHNVIEGLKRGYDTLLGNYTEVSEGEKQRICLVRALLKNSLYLVLDEPTSSLDGYLENIAIEQLKRVSEDRGLIIVTHKESVLKLADVIVVLNNKKVEFCGTLQDAMVESNTFRAIFPSFNCETI